MAEPLTVNTTPKNFCGSYEMVMRRHGPFASNTFRYVSSCPVPLQVVLATVQKVVVAKAVRAACMRIVTCNFEWWAMHPRYPEGFGTRCVDFLHRILDFFFKERVNTLCERNPFPRAHARAELATGGDELLQRRLQVERLHLTLEQRLLDDVLSVSQ